MSDYVFFSSKTQAFECNHCGGQHAPALPMPIDQFVSVGKGFVLMHKHCQKPVAPSKQVPMFETAAIKGRASDMLRELRLDDNDGVSMETEDERSARTVRDEMRAAGHEPYGIDGNSDEPDPETDPPPPREPNRGVEVYKMFDANYPMAHDYPALLDALHAALGEVTYRLLDHDTVKVWRPASPAFQAAAHWARVENAHKTLGSRPPTAGLTIPVRFSMPLALGQALATSQPKAKKARKRRAP